MTAFKLTETKANLFNAPRNFALAHAVSSDLNAAKGSLAEQFAVIFGPVDDLRQQQITEGNVAALEIGSRFVYFLVTKTQYFEQSSWESLYSALICMREHMRNHNVHKVAMPRICCDNDKLTWPSVKEIICRVFANEYTVEILICDYVKQDGPAGIIRKCRITEETTSIFKAPENHSLALSLSADFAMCSGIALQFRSKFGHIQELRHQHKHAGGVALLKDKDRYVYYLITKEHNNDRGTYASLYCALIAMREHMLQNNVTKLAIPQLGYSDNLDWVRVRNILEYVFKNVAVEIGVHLFEPMNVIVYEQPHQRPWL